MTGFSGIQIHATPFSEIGLASQLQLGFSVGSSTYRGRLSSKDVLRREWKEFCHWISHGSAPGVGLPSTLHCPWDRQGPPEILHIPQRILKVAIIPIVVILIESLTSVESFYFVGCGSLHGELKERWRWSKRGLGASSTKMSAPWGQNLEFLFNAVFLVLGT